ncbi:Panacea domain-containing protein [Salipiger abyssi]|uniref:Panacea domain-containing protein n=1 Tax=Salipiger abyssi TaxID=1250539 RepID=UPI00405A2EA4
MYDARVIANELLRRAWREGADMSQLDVQKICYFMNGHHLVEHAQPMIATEFEAWKHGPVQRILYDSFKRYGDEPITELATAFDPIRRTHKALPEITSNSVLDTIEKHFLRYLSIPAHELVGITHRSGTPWQMTREDAEVSANIGMRISTDIIAANFEGFLA